MVPAPAAAQELTAAPDQISSGAIMSRKAPRLSTPLPPEPADAGGALSPLSFIPGVGFTGYDFTTNSTENGGFVFIPPDPIGAAGQDRLVAVVNTGIECKSKTGTLLFRDSLHDFFSPLGGATLGTFTFDPKVTYDPYEDRFVVVTLELLWTLQGDPTNAGRILVAVSKTGSPASSTASDWWYLSINSVVNNSWVDYPGLEVDEEAIYITGNMVNFSTAQFSGRRLWIIDKGAGAGLYAGGAASYNNYNPIPVGFSSITMMPAKVFSGIGGGATSPTGVGTYLVGYNSLTTGGPGGQEAIQVVRVNNPLGSVSFTGEYVFMGDIESVGGVYGFPALPDAPQSGQAAGIEVNDSRALDAVWRDNSLWLTATINPNAGYDAVNAGQTTAHWVRINTSAVTSGGSAAGLLTLADQGNIGGEDIAAGAYTFFPSVAVNHLGEAKFGFAASAASIYCGAYMAGREAGDPAGTVQASGVVQAGLAPYLRYFGTDTRNRWGDYSGISVDPSDERVFWVFNQYAWTTGTPAGTGTGRWKTAWRSCAASCFEVLCPADTALEKGSASTLQVCIVNCGALDETFNYSVYDDLGWCVSDSGPLLVAAGDTVCVSVECQPPADTCPPTAAALSFEVTSFQGDFQSCETTLNVINLPPVAACQTVIVGGTEASPCSVAVMPLDVDDGSFDPGGDNISYSLEPAGPYPEGVTNVDLIVTDSCGASDTCATQITVNCLTGPLAAVTPPVTFLGTVAAGDSTCGTVWVKNVGDDDLHVASVNACDSLGFYVDTVDLLATIAPGDSSAFLACFTPKFSGAETCSVVVTTDGGTGTAVVIVDNTTAVTENRVLSSRLRLSVCPNPFGASSHIRFQLPEQASVRMAVFDLRGRQVRTLVSGEVRPAGEYEVVWDGRTDQGTPTGAGVYFIKLAAGEATWVTRAVRLR
jgi:hypothetical protein